MSCHYDVTKDYQSGALASHNYTQVGEIRDSRYEMILLDKHYGLIGNYGVVPQYYHDLSHNFPWPLRQTIVMALSTTTSFSDTLAPSAPIALTTYSTGMGLTKQKQFRKLYENAVFRYKRRYAYLTANYTAAASFRSNHIRELMFDNYAALYRRSTAERAAYGYRAEANAGITFNTVGNRRNTSVYGSLIYSRRGFLSDSATAINWSTGIEAGAAQPQEHRFYSRGFGIGVNYTEYKQVANFCLDWQLYYLWLDRYQTNNNDYTSANQLRDLGLRKHQFGARLAAGIAIRFGYRFDLHFMPSFAYDLSSVNKSNIIRSNLYDIGIITGFSYRWLSRQYHYRNGIPKPAAGGK
ncbi:MAG: hypothetical protein V4649_03755 [Bacteroidota bacterium]